MSKIFLHIGLHKTGTTFLQRGYFPKFTNANYFLNSSFFSSLAVGDKYDYFIFSREELSGLPWNHDWKMGLVNNYTWFDSFERAVINLKSVFPQAHIIIVFRKHGDLLISLYKQYIQEGGILEFEDFYNEKGVIKDSDLNFKRRVEILKEHFAEVSVLSFEKFKSSGTDYFDKFFQSQGLQNSAHYEMKRSNRSISGRKIEILRTINKSYWKVPYKIRRVLKKVRLSPRHVFQSHLKFWKSEDSLKLKTVQITVNERFEEDWKFIESEAWK